MTYLETQAITITIGKQTICQELNLSLSSGEVWGILGMNGSGKTTLLHTLAGLHAPNRGEVVLHNERQFLQRLKPKIIARSIGLLFQSDLFTFPQTVWEYAKGGRYPHRGLLQKETDNDKHIVREALKAMELHELSNRPIVHLSGGEKRRLAITSVLAQKPCIYLLDEPTNHLDIYHQVRTLSLFQKLASTEKAVVMMSLHDVNIAQQYCTHILLLFKDRVLQGRTEEMLTGAHLSHLYHHPMQRIASDNGVYWQPESDKLS